MMLALGQPLNDLHRLAIALSTLGVLGLIMVWHMGRRDRRGKAMAVVVMPSALAMCVDAEQWATQERRANRLT